MAPNVFFFVIQNMGPPGMNIMLEQNPLVVHRPRMNMSLLRIMYQKKAGEIASWDMNVELLL